MNPNTHVFPKPQPHAGARQQGEVVSEPASSMGVNPQIFPSAEVLDTGWAPGALAICSQHRLSICFSTQTPGGSGPLLTEVMAIAQSLEGSPRNWGEVGGIHFRLRGSRIQKPRGPENLSATQVPPQHSLLQVLASEWPLAEKASSPTESPAPYLNVPEHLLGMLCSWALGTSM